MGFDVDRLHTDWQEGSDQERAVSESAAYLAKVVEQRADPTLSLTYLELAIEPQLDGIGGNGWLALRALEKAKPAFRHAEAAASGDSDRQIELRIRPTILLSTTLHRLDRSTAAVHWAFMGMNELQRAVQALEGRRVGLTCALASPIANAVANHTLRLLGPLAAATRRADLAAEERAALVARCRTLLDAYVYGPSPVYYPSTPCAAVQVFYLLAAAGAASDASLIEEAYRLDLVSRPFYARAQATLNLRECAYARYRGDDAAARDHAEAARVALAEFGLPRHQRVVAARGYLAV